MFRCYEGCVLLMRQKVGGYKHLTIILNNPSPQNKVVLVNVTSYKEGKDGSCILYKDDHDWLTYEKSCIKYDAAQIVDAEKVEEYINNDYGEVQTSFDEHVFLDILCSSYESNGTPEIIKDFLSDFINYDTECCFDD